MDPLHTGPGPFYCLNEEFFVLMDNKGLIDLKPRNDNAHNDS